MTIRYLAVNRGWTSFDLSDKYGVSPTHIRRIVRGERHTTAGGPRRKLAYGKKPVTQARLAAALDLLADEAMESGLEIGELIEERRNRVSA